MAWQLVSFGHVLVGNQNHFKITSLEPCPKSHPILIIEAEDSKVKSLIILCRQDMLRYVSYVKCFVAISVVDLQSIPWCAGPRLSPPLCSRRSSARTWRSPRRVSPKRKYNNLIGIRKWLMYVHVIWWWLVNWLVIWLILVDTRNGTHHVQIKCGARGWKRDLLGCCNSGCSRLEPKDRSVWTGGPKKQHRSTPHLTLSKASNIQIQSKKYVEHCRTIVLLV